MSEIQDSEKEDEVSVILKKLQKEARNKNDPDIITLLMMKPPPEMGHTYKGIDAELKRWLMTTYKRFYDSFFLLKKSKR